MTRTEQINQMRQATDNLARVAMYRARIEMLGGTLSPELAKAVKEWDSANNSYMDFCSTLEVRDDA